MSRPGYIALTIKCGAFKLKEGTMAHGPNIVVVTCRHACVRVIRNSCVGLYLYFFLLFLTHVSLMMTMEDLIGHRVRSSFHERPSVLAKM